MGEFGGQVLVKSARDRRDRCGVRNPDDELAIAGIRLLGVVCQHESACPAPDEGRYPGYGILIHENPLEPLHLFVGRVDIGSLRHLELNVENRRVRGGEEGLLDLSESHNGPNGDANDRQNNRNADAQRHPQNPAICRVEHALVGIIRNVFGGLEQQLAEIRRHRDCQDPAC